MKGIMMQVIKPLSCSFVGGRIIFKCRVRWPLPNKLGFSGLRKEINDIFEQWSNSGDVQFGLKKLHLISNCNESYIKIDNSAGPIFHNLL